MQITYLNDRFIAHSQPSEADQLRAAGFEFDAKYNRWTSMDYRAAEKLLRSCDHLAMIKIKLLKENVKTSIAKSAASEGSMKLYHQEALVPFPYQVAGVEYMYQKSGCLLADEQGLGKTGMTLLLMNMRKDVEALIVCLPVLKLNWLKEARKWLIGKITAYIYEGKKIKIYEKRLTNHPKTTILHIINYDILEKFQERLLGTPYNFFVADECQKVKNQSAARTKVAQVLARKAKWKIFITGTPIYNRPKDLFVPLNLIDPVMFENYYVFADRYCGKKNLPELNLVLRSNYMVRRMVEDVKKDLPKKMKDIIILDDQGLATIVEKEQRVLMESKNNEDKLKADAERLKELAKNNSAYEAEYKDKIKKLRESKIRSFGELSTIRKELAIKKIPFVVDFVVNTLENSEDPQSKIVVFAHHTEVIEQIHKALAKYSPVFITGKTLDRDRQVRINLFSNKNNCRVFIGSMGAVSAGVDGLQNNCNMAAFAELDWTPSTVAQAESRLLRIGQKKPVWIYHIVADGSIDSRIAKLMVEKETISKQILDYQPEQIYEALVNNPIK